MDLHRVATTKVNEGGEMNGHLEGWRDRGMDRGRGVDDKAATRKVNEGRRDEWKDGGTDGGRGVDDNKAATT